MYGGRVGCGGVANDVLFQLLHLLTGVGWGGVGSRGALASSIDQLERLPKTTSHPLTHGVLPVGVVSTGLLCIYLLSLEGRI